MKTNSSFHQKISNVFVVFKHDVYVLKMIAERKYFFLVQNKIEFFVLNIPAIRSSLNIYRILNNIIRFTCKNIIIGIILGTLNSVI